MMEPGRPTTAAGTFEAVALLCNGEGSILSVIRDDLDLARTVEPGDTFAGFVHPSSVTKALTFLTEVRDRKAAFDWEILVRDGDGERTLYFVGGMVDDNILIAGSKTPHPMDDFLDQFMHMNNEQVNALRSALKERSTSERLYDDLSALNNDLANLQRSLYKKNLELERANEQKNHFIGMAAHDLRNPLSSFYSLCGLLISEIGGKDENRRDNWLEVLEEMKRSSKAMLELVNDLLDISKIESGKLDLRFESVDLIWFVKRNMSINRALAERKGIALSLNAPIQRLRLQIDPGKIDQVLNNLISNAVKYSVADDTVIVTVAATEDEIEVAVEDHGQGIPPQEIDKLFKPFGRTSVQSTGGELSTGLGLLICRKIVEGHGGRIWVESREGEGATFRFTVPRRSLTDDPQISTIDRR